MNFVFYLHDEKSSENIERRLLWFKKHYNLVSSQEIYSYYYEGLKLYNSCHLTIDDGWLSTYQVVFPLLKKHKIPVTIFVSPEVCLNKLNFWYYDIKKFSENDFKQYLVCEGYFKEGVEKYPLELILKELEIDEVYSCIRKYAFIHHIDLSERGFVNIEEVKEMSDSGLVEIGAHTMIHPILAAENKKRSEYEIVQSVNNLATLIDKPVTSFAYPNGLWMDDFGQREMEFANKAGIKLAYSVQPGVLNIKKSPLAIPRVGQEKRLKLGRLGLILPSLHNQRKPRNLIKSLKL
ncbi:MAG: polysaccharide deacetylase family protein [Parabacteroides sp.]|nr:polysaccharide deacetylase family protein [Parabacteroides sp.]